MGYYNQHRSHYPTTLDADAEAYIVTAGITDATQKSAVRYVIPELKKRGLWNKTNALYLFLGGTQAMHSWNARNTSQYNLTWSGTPTHNSNGVTFNANSYAITGFGSGILGVNDLHLSMYVRNSISPYNYPQDSGVGDNNYTVRIQSMASSTGDYNFSSGSSYYWGTEGTTGSNAGRFVGSVYSGNIYFYKNGSAVTPITTGHRVYNSGGSWPTGNASNVGQIYIGWLNPPSGQAPEKSQKNICWYSIGSGFSETEMADMDAVMQQYNTILGRNI